MTVSRICSPLIILFFTGAAATLAQAADPWHATKSEAAQLPLFCWGQLMSDEFRGPEYQILDCGSGMNHYCLGLLKIVRANKMFGNMNYRKDLLVGAKDDTELTLKGMQSYPNCSIREHAEKTLVQINGQLRMLK